MAAADGLVPAGRVDPAAVVVVGVAERDAARDVDAARADAMKATARDNGAVGAALSGAGSTVLALVPPDRANDVAEAFARTAKRLVVPGRIAHLTPVAVGALVVES